MGAAVARAAPRPPVRPASPDTSMVPRTFFKSAILASLCFAMLARPRWLTSWRRRGSEQGRVGLPARDKNRKNAPIITCDVIDRRHPRGSLCALPPGSAGGPKDRRFHHGPCRFSRSSHVWIHPDPRIYPNQGRHIAVLSRLGNRQADRLRGKLGNAVRKLELSDGGPGGTGFSMHRL